MATRNFAKNRFVCARCQRRLAHAGPLSPFASLLTTVKSPSQIQAPPARSFLSGLNRGSQLQRGILNTTSSANSVESAEEPLRPDDASQGAPTERPAAETSPANATSIPWYLQEQDGQSEANPFLERQRIPELPPNPPPILEGLLKHASIDLGLDYLSLLDLRSMDPPPALGANLIMLFGSARSEKHLNVSADRLCRWLRSNYKLKPLADGLLGRNELKLKLKRKNRRAKMMSAAGASSPTDPDDGITTGWICVNVGTVENGPDAVAEGQAPQPSRFVGFGSGFESARVVVQIMTETKRGELDLETLWKEALDASLRPKAALDRELEQQETQQVSNLSSKNLKSPSADPTNVSSATPRASLPHQSASTLGLPHVRKFHTSAKMQSAGGTSFSHLSNSSAHGELPPYSTSADESPTTRLDGAAPLFESNVINGKQRLHNTQGQIKKQLNYLQSLKPSLAIWLLGIGQDDDSSTTFLRAFYQHIPEIPDSEHLLARFELHCYAVKIGHRGYTRERLVQLLGEMQAAAISIPEETFLLTLKTVLMAHNALGPGFKSHSENPNERLRSAEMLGQALCRILGDAFEVIECMESYGHDVRSTHVLTILHDAIANPTFEPPHTPPSSPASATTTNSSQEILPPAKLLVSQHSRFRYLFRRALHSLYSAPLADNTLYAHVLRSYIAASPPDWASFWDMWHHFARLMRPRTADLYTLMFNGVASTEHAAKCQETLMWQFPEMERETPVVECKGEVAGAVLECLIKARVARNAPPWEEMWDAAERGL